MSKPEIGAGDLKLELDGEEVVLKPSLGACTGICRAPGGIYGPGSVAERLARCDLDTMAMLIRLGLGVGPSAIKELEERIYRTGLIVVRDVLQEFVVIVANGGRPLEPEPDAGDEAGRPPKASA